MKFSETLAVLDLDGTLLNGQSQKLLVEYLYSNGYISFFKYLSILMWYVGYKFGLISNVQSAAEFGAECLSGKSVTELEKIFDQFFIQECVPRFYKYASHLINSLRNRRMHIILVSAAIEPIVVRAKEYLNVDDYISTRLEKKGDRYSGRIVGAVIYASTKLEVVRQYAEIHGFDLARAFAFGDHVSDIPLLSITGHPVAVNAAIDLKKLSVLRSWPMLYLDNNESFQYFKSYTLP